LFPAPQFGIDVQRPQQDPPAINSGF